MATDTQALAAAGALAHILGTGDLSQLSKEARAAHYLHLCASLGLNPASVPFQWVEFYDPQAKAKKLTLYPAKSCAEQLRRQHQIRVRVVEEKIVGALFKVVVEGTTPNGRTAEEVGYVPLTDREGKQLVGQNLANAFMKCHTVAKRRLTFSMVGLTSPPDMSELSGARRVYLDAEGEVIEHPTDVDRRFNDYPDEAKASGRPRFESLPASDSPLAGTPDQRVRPEEIARPAPPVGPPPSFRVPDEEIDRFRAAWFAAVDGLSLDSDDARHAYVAQWTADEWPKAKRTDSLVTMRARMTDQEATDFLAQVRAKMDAEWARRPAPDQRPAGMTPEGHAAAVLTGAPVASPESPPRLDPDGQYTRAELFAIYDAWAARMRKLDVMWQAPNVKRLGDVALRAAVVQLIAEVDELDAILSAVPDDEPEPAEAVDGGAEAF